MSLTPYYLAFLVFSAAASSAAADALNNNKIRDAISDRKVVLSTMGFEFPLYYARDGNVTGDGSETGLAANFSPRETGQWWVANDRLCQKFPTWYKGRTWCFELKQAGESRLTWRRDDGFTGKARISG